MYKLLLMLQTALAEAIAAVNDAATAETILTALNSEVLGLEEEMLFQIMQLHTLLH
jgi:hypothetical protein